MTHVATADRTHADTSSLAVWGFAVSLATLGTAILFNVSIGINWGVWTACVVIALFAVLRDRVGSVGAPTIAAGSWAVVLAFGAAVTSDEGRVALLIAATLVLLALALVTAGDSSLDALRPLVALQAPFVAIGVVFSGLATEASDSARTARSPAVRSLVRTTLITVPLVVLLILLLAEADPIFAAARDALQHLVPDDFIARTCFFTVLLCVTVGAYGSAQRGSVAAHQPAREYGVLLGPLERRVLMTALATIMWIFVCDATLSLMKNPAAVAGSGITYAEYVHRGFAELSVAATIVISATLVTRRSWIATDAWARRLAFAAIAGECGMIAIAFMRVVRYEQAYGFTTLRLHAQAYMIVLACMSVFLLLEIARRAQSSRFAYRSTSAALAVLSVCVFFNTDAWVLRQNVDRYATTGSLDVRYLLYQLSDDATPALVESVPRLHEPERSAVVEYLRGRDANGRNERSSAWYSWNYRARQSEEAVRKFHGNDIGGASSPTSKSTSSTNDSN